jgi:MscS family membrane protein
MTLEQARELERSAKQYLQRASDALDLSRIPDTLRQPLSVDYSLKLKEIFDRMLLPPLDAIPTQQMIDSLSKEGQISSQQPASPFRWKIPNTQIEIVEIQEGDRQEQFLFSAGTVRRITDIYNKVMDLPYRKSYFGGMEQEYLSPELSPAFYTNYVSASGYLIPQLHLRGRLIEVLPNWVKAKVGKQMLWQWIGLLCSVLVALYVIFTVIRYVKLAAEHFKSPGIDWLRLLAAALLLTFCALLDQFLEEALNLSGYLRVIVTMLSSALIFLVSAWLTFVFCRTIAETIVSTSRMHTMSSESSLLRISASVVGFLIAVGIIINGFKTLGADLVPLLAGLGIGGLAVALAAQSSIANFIGGLILLSNKPVRVGDFCRYGEDPSGDWLRIGTIEEINWISTRIRGIDRTVTTIPNAEFANMHIVNLSRRDQRLMRTTLQLRYETTPEQMRYILIKLRELLLGHPMVSAEPARVRLTGFSAYSKDIEIYGYLKCTEQPEFLAIQEDLLMRIEDIITEAGSGFAFPSQTAYLARDKGLDDERRNEAETQVDRLRSTNKLPFPEFEEEEREQIENTLDYPPEGSPHHKSYK